MLNSRLSGSRNKNLLWWSTLGEGKYVWDGCLRAGGEKGYLRTPVLTFSRFARSAASRSKNSSETMPRRHPSTTPTRLPIVPTILTRVMMRCFGDKSATGRPSFVAAASMTPPKATPDTSEQICPKAAAVRVARPNFTPRVLSIKSPAWIITKLSIAPNPIMGTMLWAK